MAEIKNTNPYRNMKYQLQMAGQTVAGFSLASLQSDDGSDDEVEAVSPETQRVLSGLKKYSALTLKRGLTDSVMLQNWFTETQLDGSSGMMQDFTLVLLNEMGTQSLAWKISRAWPSTYRTSELKAGGTVVVIMSLVLQLETIEEVS